ncbi:MAG: hypothetical protein COA78_20115 [Blastopirellula sp.]|nr:MAG: hypothetical protein COA78_20115 [Blastopirellula sp.]
MTGIELNLTTEFVTDLKPEEPIQVDVEQSTESVIDLLREQKAGAALVNRGGRLAGIFTERDVLRLLAKGADLSVPIEQYMGTSVVYLKRTDVVASAITKMSEGGYRRLPIVDQNGNATALVTTADVLHYLVEHFPETIYNLPPTTANSVQEREGA